jgi:hypothetical protein
MATRNPQTQAKRARELAVREKRERKRAKKAELAEMRAAGIDPYAETDPESAELEDADAEQADEPAVDDAA